MNKELVVRGRVVRHEADGMALEWRQDDTASLKLTEMIKNASEK